METDGFRRWLAKRLRGLRYATIGMKDSDIDVVAKQLGVDPDLLLEVRAQARLDMHEQGYTRPASNRAERRQFSDQLLYQFKIRIPSECHRAWNEECERRAVAGSVLLRSLVHCYLLGSREPVPAPHWILDGRLLREERAKTRDAEKATVTHGAKRALLRRAAFRNTKSAWIVRALMMEAIRGDHTGIPLVSAGMMFEDETRYNLGENARP